MMPEIDILGEITPRVNEAIGQRVDAAIIFGDNRRESGRQISLPWRVRLGTMFPHLPGKDYYDLTLGEGGVFSKVEDDGYAVTGAIAPMTFKSKLRGLRDSNKQPIFTHNMQDSSKYALDGVPIQFPENGSFMPDIAQLVVGDFSKAVYAIRQDITVKLLTEGVIQDPNTKDIVYNLAQQDMIALRVVFRRAGRSRIRQPASMRIVPAAHLLIWSRALRLLPRR